MGTCRRGLEAPPPPPREGVSASQRRPKRAPQRTPPSPPRESSGNPGSPPREVPSMGKCRRGPEAPPSPPRESPAEGKRGPQRAPRETPRAGVLAAHEGAPLVLRDTAPGLPKKGPPWNIEGEPGSSKNFALKRPFEANNEGDAGHHENQPCGTKTPSVPLTSNHHTHRARTCHRDAALKSPVIFVLRPIERARSWRRTTQRAATSTWQTCHAAVTRASPLRRTARAGQSAPSLSNKAKFSLIAWKKHSASVP